MPTLATESHVEMSVNFRQHFLTRVADPVVWSDPDFGEEKNRVRILIRFFLDGRIRIWVKPHPGSATLRMGYYLFFVWTSEAQLCLHAEKDTIFYSFHKKNKKNR